MKMKMARIVLLLLALILLAVFAHREYAAQELRAQLLRRVFAMSKYGEQDKREKEQNDPCHLHLHAALSFPQNHIISYSISLACAQRN